ncbi:Uncharacterized protein TCM_041262 [Theobroma cacao]|uniref:Aspartic peptidase DDI1-type domain-containing protein n=1 Tax=Theobroma cacao TaxID=3641 RepID=A0A061GZM7_THECC|nr:Uncharacterized protein TCM_041262 [Theobroma cacao]
MEPHQVADCPHKMALSAICTVDIETPPSHLTIEDFVEEPTRMEVLLNEKRTKVMVDMGPSDTFITLGEAKRCGFKVEKDFGQIKVVNSLASVIMENSKDVKVKNGS